MDNEPVKKRRYRGIIGPTVLVGVGIVLLLVKNGMIDRQLVWQWWPLLLIVIGGAMLISRLRDNDR